MLAIGTTVILLAGSSIVAAANDRTIAISGSHEHWKILDSLRV